MRTWLTGVVVNTLENLSAQEVLVTIEHAYINGRGILGFLITRIETMVVGISR